ncbi:glycosyl hydrolase family 95 catalytic domain-containing protein [Variovorax guangxiensis]|nr:glycoside hydrolase N-terminal domain-containing protein [Variovorax guangxiensis]
MPAAGSATASEKAVGNKAAVLAASSAPFTPASIASRALWYDSAASDWESQALPIGNARLGAMLFAGASNEQIQFNEQSLWGGVNNYDNALAGKNDDAFDTSVTGFGSYRSFGDIALAFIGSVPSPQVTWPEPQGSTSATEGVAKSVDGSNGTKWCVDGPGTLVLWQVALPQAAVVSAYTLTSANDVPARDPQQWTLAGSNDGTTWTTLDTRSLPSPFESRAQSKTFNCSNTTAYRFYRFAFVPKTGVSHFQVAEIALAGLDLKPGAEAAVSGYRRTLDLGIGVHTTEFSIGSRKIVREAFASKAHDVMVFRYTASDAQAFSGTLTLTSAQGAAAKADAATAQVSFSGAMANGLKYACAVQVVREDGQLTVDGNALRFDKCTSLTLLVDARTDYKLDYAAGWRSTDPAPRVQATLAVAASKTYATLRQAHVADFGAVMSRAGVVWGETDATTAALSTRQRLQRYAGGATDPGLEQAMFDYGRYLLVSSSRPGGLPANLQGLWNNSNSPAWGSDYHTNINVQMNYWGAESTGLSDCHTPLIDFVSQVAGPSRVATRNAFGANTRGWTARTSQSIFGGNGWNWNNVSSAWYAQHLYEHFAFTQDLNYLRVTAYPMLKEICQFWEDRLKTRADGLLVSPKGWSPEHGPTEDGVMYDQQIIWDLFQNYLDAARTLNIDTAYQSVVAGLQAKLAPNKVGKWGQLQEWQEDIDDPKDIHRHTSHLFAVYPGRQITPVKTPAFAAAALVSLKARCGEVVNQPFTAATVTGDSRRSWTWPWRCALFARLGDAARAQTMLRGLLSYNTLQNLFCNHPPFQMDGNFGISGALTEMLLQSHEGVIVLLPACPDDWKAAGAFNGLRARGGYRVSCVWKNGQVVSWEIVADKARNKNPVRVRINGEERDVTPT